MASVLHDLRYAVRGAVRAPGVTFVAVVSLALGIGATTAIFSVAYALLFRPLPYPDPNRLTILWNRSPGLGIAEDWFSTAQYFDITSANAGFDELAIAIGANYTLTGEGVPERIGVLRISANLLPMLGASAAAGRLFRDEDNTPGQTSRAILSYATWQRRFGGDLSAIGRTLTLNGQPFEIIGALPPGFSIPREVMPTLGVAEDGDIYLPLPLPASAANVRTGEDYNIVGRLAPGVAIEEAQAALDRLTARLRQDHPAVYPPHGGLTFSVVPLHEQVVGRVRQPLLLLLGAVALVLLIACANVANVLLARAMARTREVSIRVALGAGRGRLIQQWLTESALLGIVGGLAGTLLAAAALRGLQALQPASVPRLTTIRLDLTVLLFAAGVSLAATLLFGLAPALRASRRVVKPTPVAAGMRQTLATAQFALAVMLLIAAGLLIRSFARVLDVSPGFTPQGVLSFELSMIGPAYPNAAAVSKGYERLWERLAQLPGVRGAGGITSLPLSNFFAWGPITIEGRVPPPGEAFINADQRSATSQYFEAMGIPLLRGRYFTTQDTPDQPRVVIIDEQLANTFFPGEDPLGKRLHYGDAQAQTPWETIVGVVGNVKQYALDSGARVALYRPHTQSVARSLYVVLKTDRDPATLAPEVVRAVADVDPNLPVFRIRTMDQRIDASLAQRRFAMLLFGAFAALAAALAAIGVYGVMAYLVRQTTREIGIRSALGATPGSIAASVVRRGAIIGGGGILVGLAGALGVTQLMGALLFEVQAMDALTFTTMPLFLFAVALLASYVPARVASRIDPVVALKRD